MFDYDARPVTPLRVLGGATASRGAYPIRDFLSRNGFAFEWVDAVGSGSSLSAPACPGSRQTEYRPVMHDMEDGLWRSRGSPPVAKCRCSVEPRKSSQLRPCHAPCHVRAIPDSEWRSITVTHRVLRGRPGGR
jgi:hypothetical protein